MKAVAVVALISAVPFAALAPAQNAAVLPRVEVLDAHRVALRFDPQLIHDRHVTVETAPGRVTAADKTEFHYRIPVPYWLEKTQPVKLELTLELSAPAPAAVQIAVNGIATPLSLTVKREQIHFSVTTVPGPEIEVTVQPEHGISIYGAGAGRFAADPVILVHTAKPVAYKTGWSMNDNSGTPLPAFKPLFDYPVRDTSIILGGDGNFYLTGTTGDPDMWAVTGNLQLWKSPDLNNWTTVIERPRTRSVVWNVDREGSWEKPIALRDGNPFRPLWAPEVHYLKGTYWLTYSLPFLGIGLLKSTTGKPEGPYAKAFTADRPIANGIDASLFEDTDGQVYFLYGGGRIARIRDDMTGLAEPFRSLVPAAGGAPYVGFEGVYLFKANGKYHLGAADFVFGDYHCYAAESDNIYGPYSARYLAVPHAGHNTFFQDKTGNWWSTFFGNDARAPFRERPAALRIEFTPEGRIQVQNAR